MANTQRDRGYIFESWLVKKLNYVSPMEEWNARRLGGSSTGLPDVVAINNHNAILFAIEAKSNVTDWIAVPQDEFERCYTICKMFKLYYNSHVVLAFKFGADIKNKNKIYKLARGKEGTKKKRTRKDIKTYFFVMKNYHRIDNIDYVRCNYKGELFIKTKDKNQADPELDYYMFEDIDEMKRSSQNGFTMSHLKHC